MRFVTLFLKTENVHLLKDVGLIPYYLYKEHDYDCVIATYNNSAEYSYLNDEVKGLKLDLVKKTKYGKILDGIGYIIKNGRKIDILNVYHLNLSSFFYEIAYKLVNPRGKIYLKLDMNPIGLINCFKKDPRGFIKRCTISMSDIASVETTGMQKRLRKFYLDKIIYIPNGSYQSVQCSENIPNSKENIILTVGNLGTYEKATDVLLRGYGEYIRKHPDSNYVLRLVGSVDESFNSYIDDFFEENAHLRDRITFTGPITDKQKLNEEYRRARIFVLPSLSESFGIVLVEAAKMGCYLITSDMVPAGFDVSEGFKYGLQVKAGDVDDLARGLSEACERECNWEELAKKTAAHVETAFNWPIIINRLDMALKKLVAR